MDQAQLGTDQDRGWEHHLFSVLLAAFGLATAATVWPALAPAAAPAVAEAAGEPSFPLPLPASGRAGFVAMAVVDLIEDEGDGEGVVLLEDGTSEIVLPIFVDAAGVAAVREGLALEGTGAPGLIGLLGASLAALGASLERVEVESDGSSASRAHLVLRQEGLEVEVEASPSEALALALVTRAPVYTAEALLQSRGIQREQVRRRPGALPNTLKPPERL